MPLQEVNVVLSLINKLGHSLEEIRCRAVRSLWSKIQCGTLSIDELVQQRSIYRALLDWFNVDHGSEAAKFPEEGTVLALLEVISEHHTGTRFLIDFGAVEFLSRLRLDLTQNLQSKIDIILDNLMKLPPMHLAHSMSCAGAEHVCVYIARNERIGNAGENICMQHSSVAQNAAIDASSTVDMEVNDTPNIGYFDKSSSSGTRSLSHASKSLLMKGDENQEKQSTMSNDLFRFGTFPWVPLPPTDRHVLSSTLNSLRNADKNVIIGSIEFLRDVIFLDFPAEVFFQRNLIIRTLLGLFSSGDPTLSRPACLCFVVFCRKLKERMTYHLDPSNYLTKTAFSDVLADTCLLQSPAGEESSTENEDTDGEELNDIRLTHYTQYSVPGFVLELLHYLLTQLVALPHVEVSCELFELLHVSTDVLTAALDSNLWLKFAATDLAERTLELLQKWAAVISRCAILEEGTPPNNCLPRLRHVALAAALIRFLRQLLPPDAAGLAVLPESVRRELASMLLDEGFLSAWPDEANQLRTWASYGDSSFTLVCTQRRDIDSISEAMRALCDFLLVCDTASVEPRRCAQYASAALPALPHCTCLKFVRAFVSWYSNLCTQSAQLIGVATLTEARQVLLALLAHSTAVVQKCTYASCLNIVVDALSVDAVDTVMVIADKNTKTNRILFLLQHDVLLEVAVFGVDSALPEVCKSSRALLLNILDARLSMDSKLWNSVLQSVQVVLPALQSHAAATEPHLQAALLLHFCSSKSPNDTACFPPRIQRLRTVLRQLYSSQVDARQEGARRLVEILLSDPATESKQPSTGLSDGAPLDLRHLCALFQLSGPPRRVEVLPLTVDFAEKQSESLRKVYDIFINDRVDVSVRRSAGQQVAIFLQNVRLHEAFISKLGGIRYACDLLKRAIYREEAFLAPLLTPCAAILRRVAHFNAKMRCQLADDFDLYSSLVRLTLFMNYDEESKYECAHLLALLLFYELTAFAPFSNGCEEFRLPVTTLHHIQLPFRCATYMSNSAHSLVCAAPASEHLAGPIAQRALRVCWNEAWFGGRVLLLDHFNSLMLQSKLVSASDYCAEDYSERMKLTSLDAYFVCAACPAEISKQACRALENAHGHRAAVDALMQLRLCLLCAPVSGLAKLDMIHLKTPLSRFFSIQATSSADYRLLLRLLQFLELYIRLGGNASLEWLMRCLTHTDGPLLRVLGASDNLAGQTDSARLVDAKKMVARLIVELAAVLSCRMSFLSLTKNNCRVAASLNMPTAAVIVDSLVQRLQMNQTNPFFNLAQLEAAMETLMHVTATLNWSESQPTLRAQTLHLCLDVLHAFQSNRREATLSFMGMGVMRGCLLTLLHIARDAMVCADDVDMWHLSEPKWLLTLCSFRQSEIRATGLGIATYLIRNERLSCALNSACAESSLSGLWLLATTLLSDLTECCIVRVHAAQLFCALLTQTLHASDWSLHNNKDKGSGSGKESLLTLVENGNLLRTIALTLTNYYPYPTSTPPWAICHTSPPVADNSGLISVSTNEDMHHRDAFSEGALAAPSAPQSIATPALVSALCHVLNNLLLQLGQYIVDGIKDLKILRLLLNLVDSDLFSAALQLGSDLSSVIDASLSLPPLLPQMVSCGAAILRLLRLLVKRTPLDDVASTLLQDTRFLSRLVRLFAIGGDCADAHAIQLEMLWKELAYLIIVLLQAQSFLAHSAPAQWSCNVGVVAPLSARVHTLGRVVMALVGRSETQVESRSVLLYAVAVFCQDWRLSAAPGLDKVLPAVESSVGSQLANFLISRIEAMPSSSEKIALCVALKALLGASKSSKEAALGAGLLESAVEQIRFFHNKLQLELMQVAANRSRRRESYLVCNLTVLIDLLTNLLHDGSQALRQAACDVGLAQTLHRLWPVAALYPSTLQMALLRFLVNFSAHCPAAVRALAHTTPDAATLVSNVSLSGSSSSTAGSLLQLLVRQAARFNVRDQGGLLRAVFAILGNVAWTSEGRGVLCKSRLLNQLPMLNAASAPLLSWSLRILVNLSQTSDGASMLIRVPEILPLLLDLAQGVIARLVIKERDHIRFNAALILRNLAVWPNCRVLLLGAGGDARFVSVLSSLLQEQEQCAAVAVSCIAAMLHKNLKARTRLRSLLPLLVDLRKNVVHDQTQSVVAVLQQID